LPEDRPQLLRGDLAEVTELDLVVLAVSIMPWSIQSGTISIIVQSQRDLSRDVVNESMSSAHHNPSRGGTT
jgi:hypothetical protein